MARIGQFELALKLAFGAAERYSTGQSFLSLASGSLPSSYFKVVETA
jgi:hypothetical protein